MATKAELLVEAKELGIKDAESLSYNDLRKAVSEAKNTSDTATDTESASDSSDEAQEDENTQDNTGDNPDDNLGDQNNQDNAGDNPNANLEEVPTYFEDENGNKFGFTKRTPEKFRFNGVIKTQAEWLQDEDAMEMLIYGNSMYINQLND